MIYCDNIVENDSIFLYNLDKNASDAWSTPSSNYGIYRASYNEYLNVGDVYYCSFKYKFTTTNQSPTWATMCLQSGHQEINGRVYNVVAGTEYDIYGVATCKVQGLSLAFGDVYNGNSGAIKGVSAQVKNMCVYNVTSLYKKLLANGVVKNESELRTWCHNNLEWKACGVKYDVTSLVQDTTKVVFKGGDLVGDIVECDGMEYYSYSTRLRNNTYFDTGSGLYIYNNANNDAVTHERVDAKAQNSPFYPEHKYVLKITTNGTANPSCGGFQARHMSAANKIFIEKFVAKIPVGYNIVYAFNAQGTGREISYLTPRKGTGKWEEYAILYKCGSSGDFSDGGHVYLSPDSGYSATSVTWYLAYANNCDITSNPELKNYTVLNNKDVIKGSKLFTRQLNTANLFPNGDLSDTNMPLPSGFTYDTTDITGSGKASIVQAVSTSQPGALYTIPGTIAKLAINPCCRYKISFWVKSKGDMTNFTPAIICCVNDKILNITDIGYVSGTKTTLTAPLKQGDTTVTVSSNANWVVNENSKLGFRSYGYSYNNLGTVSKTGGMVAGLTGSNTINLTTTYTGSTIASGNYICETTNGSYYIYPFSKSNLPTDNTWKYIEAYIGGDNVLYSGDGTPNAYYNFQMPYDTTHILLSLNMKANDGTTPIKYSDIRIEAVGKQGHVRNEKKIQIKKFNG